MKGKVKCIQASPAVMEQAARVYADVQPWTGQPPKACSRNKSLGFTECPREPPEQPADKTRIKCVDAAQKSSPMVTLHLMIGTRASMIWPLPLTSPHLLSNFRSSLSILHNRFRMFLHQPDSAHAAIDEIGVCSRPSQFLKAMLTH